MSWRRGATNPANLRNAKNTTNPTGPMDIAGMGATPYNIAVSRYAKKSPKSPGLCVTRPRIRIERHATPNPSPIQKVDPNPNPRKISLTRMGRRNIARWRPGVYSEMALGGDLRTLQTLGTLRTIRTLKTLGTLGSLGALRTLGTLEPVGTKGILGALGTLGTLGTLEH